MSSLKLIRPDLISHQAYLLEGENLAYRLHSNELPWPPLNDETLRLNQYPSAVTEKSLQSRLAKLYKVALEEVVVTRGSDEAIDLLMRLFIQPGMDSILQFPPTFSMYAFFARLSQATIINCPLNEANNFSLKLEDIKAKWQPHCKLIMLCRPNNPTGTIYDLSLVKSLCETFSTRAMIIVDEAYVEFSHDLSAASLINHFDNLIVLRTLSKAYGLAGLRIGSIISQQQTLMALRAIMSPFHLSTAVMNLALRALTDLSWFQKSVDTILYEREKLFIAFEQLSWIEKIYPSASNFIFLKTKKALALFHYCKEHGIAIRHFTDLNLASYLRITVGSSQQNRELLTVINSFNHTGAV